MVLFQKTENGTEALVETPATEPGLVDSIVLGIVEGLTEFLPISSTGHLIVANRLLGGSNPNYEVVIQAGAITAIVVLYHRRLRTALSNLFGSPDAAGSPNLFFLLLTASIPAVAIGLSYKDWIEAMLFNPVVVGSTMVLGGFVLIWLERWLKAKGAEARPLERIGYRDAFLIGVFQVLAMIPGTSRSGATIAGAMVLGFSRTAAAEFSFLLGLPILYGACLKVLYDDWDQLTGPLLDDVLIGSVASFISALFIVVPFVRFLQRHDFVPFAIYRIVVGVIVLGLALSGFLEVTD